MIWIGFSMQTANTPTYPVMCQFPLLLHYVITIYPLQTDGQTRHHAHSISATCEYWCYTNKTINYKIKHVPSTLLVALADLTNEQRVQNVHCLVTLLLWGPMREQSIVISAVSVPMCVYLCVYVKQHISETKSKLHQIFCSHRDVAVWYVATCSFVYDVV